MCDLSIILLVWRDVEFLPRCLESIAAAKKNLELEIVLVANGIPPETLGLVFDASRAAGQAVSRYASIPIHMIHNQTNRGVAPARNQGLPSARGRYLMLLDVDTQVTPDALNNLVQFMDENPAVGLAGARLEDANGTLQLTCRRLPTVWSKLLRRVAARWAYNALADEMLVAYDHRTPRAVDYVIGACQIIRRKAFEQVGLLDEQFFYGPEDVDYCIRMWRNGWRVMYVPSARVVHAEQRLTRRRAVSKLTVLHALGLARYFWKYRYAFNRPRVANGA